MKKIKYVALTIFSVSILFFQCTSSNKEKIHKQLQSEIDLINQKAPVQISEIMQIDSCVLHPNNDLEYFYTITDSIAPDKNYFKNLEAEVRKAAKTDAGMADIRSYKVSTKYNYRDVNGTLLYSFEISPDNSNHKKQPQGGNTHSAKLLRQLLKQL